MARTPEPGVILALFSGVKSRSKILGERGAAMVEAVLALPVTLLFVLFFMQTSVYLFNWVGTQLALNRTARWTSLGNPTDLHTTAERVAAIKDRLINQARPLGVHLTAAQINVRENEQVSCPGSESPGEPTKYFTISASFPPVLGNFTPFHLLQLRSVVTAKNEPFPQP